MDRGAVEGWAGRCWEQAGRRSEEGTCARCPGTHTRAVLC